MTSHAHDSHDAGHGHGDHAHMPFQAHHFDDPEQQFDAGKLGIWLFLVTEVLFFSGMFCAYALYRSLHPEVFTFASQYLNETLGATNTGVLLFSSLSMAWGVRCAQLRQRTGLVICLAITLGCAAVFLGVKAIEYTHKWDMGLLPAGTYVSQFLQTSHHEGLSSWLYVLSAVPAVCVVGFGIWYVMSVVSGDKARAEIAGPFLVTALCYFLGVYIGIVFQNAEAAEHAKHETAAHASETHDEHGHADASHAEPEATAAAKLVSHVEPNSPPGSPTLAAVDQAGGAGVFFSIYYCMTGVHAIHILGGIAVLAWLLVRATKDHFNAEYFGPVDYVGLYWHLVDLIWIYLFPLLYLIK
ncbi:MAG: cytochrome c oxidase subunit 3 [Pirellulaceae bacterium]|nr:cytochrome c oxidase subunit 3 [Pirellulaceae bacterium]